MQEHANAVTAINLRTESRNNPLGIDAVNPRLSWHLQSQVRGTAQSGYQVRVATSLDNLKGGSDLVWDSGRISSAQSVLLPYAGPPLRSRHRYYWHVRVWHEKDAASPWSEHAWWEMGLLSRTDWQAQWIAPPVDPDQAKSTPAPLLRSTFELGGKIAYARLYVTSLGLYELHLNGRRVGDALFTPGWTSFGKRLQYQTYDITELLTNGLNAVGAVLGDGWYRWVPLKGKGWQKNNGKPLALLFQLEVTYKDGHTQTIVTNADWRTANGPILGSEIYHGEAYDARLERDGWTDSSYDDRDWACVALIESPSAALVSTVAQPIRRIEELKPAQISRTAAGVSLIDFGQTMVGWVRLRVRGTAGTTVRLRHAEVLDADGNLYTEPLRGATQLVQYTLRGKDEEVFEPHFTYQGFRYVTVEGYTGELTPDTLTGIVIHSDMEPTGTLETSNALINQLQHNIIWSLKGNYLEVPTDCPQRDERLGWGLDAELFMPTAALNMNVASFFTKWLGDLATDQLPNGAVPMEIPRATSFKSVLKDFYTAMGRESTDPRSVEWIGAPGYGDAATIVPWYLYLAYGDAGILQAQYPCMSRWVRYIETEAGEARIWNPAMNLGDWLDVSTTVKRTWMGATAYDLIATAYYAHSVDILHRTAVVLGKQEDAGRYADLLLSIREAFSRRFVSDDGRVGEGTQTAYVLALDFDLMPDALRPLAARRLADDVRERGHVTTGLAGTQHLLNVLSRFGYDDEAYMLLNRQEMPSWLYSVTKGATTIWERWDGIRPDGSFQDARMNSFNQYALGSIGEWLYGVMAGIALDPETPGYKHIVIQPRPGGGLSRVRASYITPYGKVSTSWRIDGAIFFLGVVIPPNTSATVSLPAAKLDDVLEGGRRMSSSNGILSMRQSGPNVVVEIGSGQYEFRCTTAK